MFIKRSDYLPCAVIFIFFSGYPLISPAKQWSFDIAQLSDENKNIDLTLFERGGQLPGRYPVDIYLNGEHVDAREMVFNLHENANGKAELKTCLHRVQLDSYGIKTEDYPGLFADSQCARLSIIPQATETYQFHAQKLMLSIPQVALRPKLKGIAPQPLWDDGISALMLNYRTNMSWSEFHAGRKSTNNAQFVQLEPGGNSGAWRLRNLTTWNKQSTSSGKWQTAYTYAERGLYDLKSRLTLGDRSTAADIFGSVPFRGGMLSSDENMVPYSQREYVPAIRGIARTQARIEVQQNGYSIYSTTVAPGPFALNDLPGRLSGSDLVVTVHEADGSSQVFTVPSATPAIALQQGYLKYGLMAGLYRPADASVASATVAQATAMYGFPWAITAYGGVQGSAHYQAAALGAGKSLNGLGALSFDAMHAKGQLSKQAAKTGQMWRARYSKTLESTGAGIALSHQIYTPHFTELSSVLDSYRAAYSGTGGVQHRFNHPRQRSSLMLSQPLGEWGYLNLNTTRERYWGQKQPSSTWGASYSTAWQNISGSLNLVQRQYRHSRQNEREISLWLSVPLDRWLGGSTRATYQVITGNQRDVQHEAGINGKAFDQQLRWDVRQRFARPGHSAARDAHLVNLNWNNAYGEVNGGYSDTQTSRQLNAGLAGSVVAHQQGVTFGQPRGQTSALVKAPGASGTGVNGWPGVKTDYWGYTTLANLTPYQENVIRLDPNMLPVDVEVPQTDTRVVPTAGAIIPASFVTRSGGRALIALTQPDGRAVPFGAVVSVAGQDTDHIGAGIVGEQGEVYMSGLPDKGHLQVSWGEHKQCLARYQLPEKKGPAGVYAFPAVCDQPMQTAQGRDR